MCLRRKEKGESEVLSGGFRLRDSEAEQNNYDSCTFVTQFLNQIS